MYHEYTGPGHDPDSVRVIYAYMLSVNRLAWLLVGTLNGLLATKSLLTSGRHAQLAMMHEQCYWDSVLSHHQSISLFSRSRPKIGSK